MKELKQGQMRLITGGTDTNDQTPTDDENVVKFKAGSELSNTVQ